MRIHIALFCLTLLLAPALTTAAGNPVGKVIFLKGGAFANVASRSRNLVVGSSLQQHDQIVTGHGARLAMEMIDGAIITLGADTRFRILSYRQARGNASGDALLELLKGAFRAITGKLGNPAHPAFRVRTPVATLGVRGTTFWGGFHFGDALDVALISGKGIYIENEAGQVEITQPGFGTTVHAADQAPTRPKQWPTEKVLRAVTSTSWGH
jgi:hypothetical protein